MKRSFSLDHPYLDMFLTFFSMVLGLGAGVAVVMLIVVGLAELLEAIA